MSKRLGLVLAIVLTSLGLAYILSGSGPTPEIAHPGGGGGDGGAHSSKPAAENPEPERQARGSAGSAQLEAARAEALRRVEAERRRQGQASSRDNRSTQADAEVRARMLAEEAERRQEASSRDKRSPPDEAGRQARELAQREEAARRALEAERQASASARDDNRSAQAETERQGEREVARRASEKSGQLNSYVDSCHVCESKGPEPDAAQQKPARTAATDSSKDARGFCERQPDACLLGTGEAAVGPKAEEASRILGELIREKQQLPRFQWPPPAASAVYVIPHIMFRSAARIGDVTSMIVSVLERQGYVEHSFFETDGGIALVTRIERINEDAYPITGRRWPERLDGEQARDLSAFLRGLFFAEQGRYRILVFVIQERPFAQSEAKVTADAARNWLTSGSNTLTKEIAETPLTDEVLTALIYEFTSAGHEAKIVHSRFTGLDHLMRAGILPLVK